MPRNLRKGKRRNYKKLDEGVEILDELLPADHETEEEQENDLSPKESDVNDDNRVSDGDESEELVERHLEDARTDRIGKKEKLRALQKELDEVEKRVSLYHEKSLGSSRSMKEVEAEVNRILDGKKKSHSRSNKGKKKSIRRKKRYVSTSSEQSSTDASSESSSSSESDSSSSDSDSQSKRKSSRRRSKNKSKSGRISRRSGKNRKISSYVKYPQQWPHSQLSLHYVSKDKKYDDLSIQEFCAGYATIIENTRSKNELKYRITHLKDLMYLATKYRWDCVLSFHAACLLEIERGHLHWGDSFQSLQITTLAGGFIQNNSISQRPYTLRLEGPIAFCKNFQRGQCTEDSDHMGELNGNSRLLRHICARCWLLHRKKASHAEDDEECPSRE